MVGHTGYTLSLNGCIDNLNMQLVLFLMPRWKSHPLRLNAMKGLSKSELSKRRLVENPIPRKRKQRSTTAKGAKK